MMNMKRALAILLSLVMLISLLPVSASADSGVTFRVDTGSVTSALSAGDSLRIPIYIDTNIGFAAADMSVTYDTSAFELTSYEQGNIGGTYVIGDSVVWYNNTNITATGVFFYANLKVKDGAPAGVKTIDLKWTNGDASSDFNDENFESPSYTFTPGTVTIAGEAPSALTFTDGANTYDYDTLKADTYTLTAPGADYYFAGWFAGLTVDGTKIVNEGGRYVLSSADTADLDSITATELRPKYEAAPESGEYHALWIHENDTNPTVMVLEVYPASITYRKLSYTDNDKEIITSNDVFRNAWNHVAGGDNGRVKMVKNLTTDNVGYKGSASSDYINYGLWIDLNGCTMTGAFAPDVSSWYSGGSVLYLRDDDGGAGAVDSSHGQGRLVLDTSGKTGYITARKVLELSGNSQHSVKWVRDVDLICDCSDAYLHAILFGGTTLELMDNVNITQNCQAGNTFYAMYSADVASRKTYIEKISNCTISTNGIIYRQDYPGTWTHMIENCTFTSSATTGNGLELSGDVTFGEGNIITTDAPTLLAGTSNGGGNLYFKADGVYSAAEGGNAFDSSVIFAETPVAGTVAHNNNGTLEFVGGFTLTYMNHDGTELLWKDSYATGETPVDNRSLTYPIDHVSQYAFDGWGTGVGTGVIDVTALTADTTLYAQRTLTTLPTVVIRTVGEYEPEYFALWEDAVDIPTRMGEDNALTWGKNVTLQLQQDVTGSAKVRSGYYKLTYDLNGHTFTYTGADGYSGVFYGDSYASEVSSLTITSTAAEKGVLHITNNTALYYMATSNNTDNPLTINNVRIEAPNLVSSGTGTSYYSDPNGLIYIINNGTGATAINDVYVTDSELVAPQAPVIDYYTGKTSANTKINATLVNSSLEGGNYAVNIHGSNSANPVFTLTADKDCTFKNAAGTDPIKTAAGNLKLKTTYPEGYEYKAIGEGWYGFVPQLSYNDGADQTVDAAGDVAITAPTSGAVTVTTPAALAELDSLTVNATAASVVFSAEALDDIAAKATGDLVISITEGTAQDGEAKRIALTATVGGTPVAFSGEVNVTVPFTGESGKNYAVYFDNNGTLELLQSTRTADSISFTTTHFSDYVIKENEGYNMTVATAKDHYNAGETFEATITLTRGEAQAIRGFQFDLQYDSSKLTLNGITLGSDFTGANSSINGAKVAGATTGAGVTIDANGKLLATVSFTVNEDVVDLSTDTITLNADTAVCSHALDGNELKSTVTGKTVTLHNIVVTLNADAHSTVDSGASKTLYAKYNESGLYSDKARSTAVTSVTAAANTGYKLKDNNWIDESSTEYADYAAIAALTFTEAKTFTLQTIAQYTITIEAAEHGTTTGSTDPITVDDGTLLSAAGLPTYTPEEHYTYSHWVVTPEGGTAQNVTDLSTYTVTSNVTVKYVAVPSTFNFTGDDTTGVTETVVSGVAGTEPSQTVTYLTDAVLTYEYPGTDKVISSITVTVNGTPITVTPVNNNGVWTLTIPGAQITGPVSVSVSLSNLWTVNFTNGTGVQTINVTATVIEGHVGYFSSVAAAKAGGDADVSVPTPAAETGYRLADEAKLWKDSSNAEFSASALASLTFSADDTFTAQAVKTYVVTFNEGEHGTLSSTEAKTVDENTLLSALTLPTITPAEGYEADTPNWKITETASGADFAGTAVTTDLTYTAQYKAKTFTLTLPQVDGVEWTVTGAVDNGDGTYTVTYGVPVTITMTAGDGVKVTEVKGTIGGTEKHSETNAEGIATDTWSIAGNEILGDIAVTIQSNKTFTVTLVAGDEHVHITPSAKTYDEGQTPEESDFTINFDAGYELDSDGGFAAGIASVTADTTYTVTSKNATYAVTKDGADAGTATHGTDYEFTPSEDVGEDKIVIGQPVVTIGGTTYPVVIDPETGKVTIPGADITGPIAITYNTIDGKWKFITYDAYKGSKTGYQIAILETSYLAESKFSLSGYGETYYSEPTAYGGYVWFVGYQETANTLTSKLTANVAGAATKLTYVGHANGATIGDINGTGIVTAADAGIINDVLHQNASTGVIYTISDKMRFELDVMGDGSVTAQDVQWILDEVVGKTH